MSNAQTPNPRKFKLGDSNVNIDPDFPIYGYIGGGTKVRLHVGQRVVYSASRGSYYVGYFLGSSKSGEAVCILNTYGYSISRISPHHLLITDWQDAHLRKADDFLKIFNEYKDSI